MKNKIHIFLEWKYRQLQGWWRYSLVVNKLRGLMYCWRNARYLPAIPPGASPYLYDAYHMRTTIGKNVSVMSGGSIREELPYIIVVNTKTGKRLQIML